MRYAQLPEAVQKEIDTIIEVFRVRRLVHLDKIQMGLAISRYMQAFKVDGDAFVHQVYEKELPTDPLGQTAPALYLLLRFLTLACRVGLFKHGIKDLSEHSEYVELAQDAIDIALDRPLRRVDDIH